MLGEAGLVEQLANRDGEAVRHRPGERGVAERAAARSVRRGADLPHRSFSRQGAGAEHPRVPLRQRLVRADLESQFHRPCADRCAGNARPGQARRLLRSDRRLSRHGRHPPVPDPRLHGDGAADRARADADQRGEEQGLPQHAADPAGRCRARPVHRLSGRARGRQRIGNRDLHRAEMQHRQLALGRRAVLPAHRQAARPKASASSRSPFASRRRACFRPARGSARRGPIT